MRAAAVAERRAGACLPPSISRGIELGGELRFLARLLAAPPSPDVLRDAVDAGFAPCGAESRQEECAVEYTRLFSVPGPDSVPACQSIYTDVLTMEASDPDPSGCGMSFPGGTFRGYLGQASASESARWYRAAGYEPPWMGRMADHVSVLLDFMGSLLIAEADQRSRDRQEEERQLRAAIDGFRARFVDLWFPAFAERLSRNEVSELYRRVGARLRDILSV